MSHSPPFLKKMDKIDILLCICSILFVVVCPFTKVEETFNLHAIHDFLHLPWLSSNYDHHTFPGVVPRTSIGAFLVASLSYPYFKIFPKIPGWTPLHSLILVRSIMSCIWTACISHFRRSIKGVFGVACSQMTGLFILSQFHLVYYGSRTLPNTFALYFGRFRLSLLFFFNIDVISIFFSADIFQLLARKKMEKIHRHFYLDCLSIQI
jgi:alpha-1,6-mannosyltransferase